MAKPRKPESSQPSETPSISEASSPPAATSSSPSPTPTPSTSANLPPASPQAQIARLIEWLEARDTADIGRIVTSIFTEIPIVDPINWVGGVNAFGDRCRDFVVNGLIGDVPALLPVAHHIVSTTGLGHDPKNLAFVLLRIAASNVVCAMAIEKRRAASAEAAQKPSSKLVLVSKT